MTWKDEEADVNEPKPTTKDGPCPKCGNKVWDGPRYDRDTDQLMYACADCRYIKGVTPLDRVKP